MRFQDVPRLHWVIADDLLQQLCGHKHLSGELVTRRLLNLIGITQRTGDLIHITEETVSRGDENVVSEFVEDREPRPLCCDGVRVEDARPRRVEELLVVAVYGAVPAGDVLGWQRKDAYGWVVHLDCGGGVLVPQVLEYLRGNGREHPLGDSADGGARWHSPWPTGR
jgi:hypothetical protein